MARKPLVLAEADFLQLVSGIVRQLDGLSVGQIEHVLRAASKTVSIATAFDAGAPAVQHMLATGDPPPAGKAN